MPIEVVLTHTQRRESATHYAQSAEFFELFEADSFDVEAATDIAWMGYIRNDDGTYTLMGEFVFDVAGETEGSGKGWYAI